MNGIGLGRSELIKDVLNFKKYKKETFNIYLHVRTVYTMFPLKLT